MTRMTTYNWLLVALVAAAVAGRPAVAEDAGGAEAFCMSAKIHDADTLSLCPDFRYRVRGKDLMCEGRYNVTVTRSHVLIRLRRARCGGGVDWSGDTIKCAITGGDVAAGSVVQASAAQHGGEQSQVQAVTTACLYMTTPEAKKYGYGDHTVMFQGRF